MLIKTILNKLHKLKSFVYQDVKLGFYQGSEVFHVTVVPRKNSHAICSGCYKPAPGYDHLAERRFEFIPLWGIRVFLLYIMRRVECKTCGARVEQVPWADGKKELTKVYMQFLSNWARKLSWKEAAITFYLRENHTASKPIGVQKSLYIMLLASFLNQKCPTDFTDEADF